MTSIYEEPRYSGSQELRDAIDNNDPDVLGPMIVAAALHEENFDIVYKACVQLSKHPDEIVRGNAILGLGHLARLFGRLEAEAPRIVRDGLLDASDYVRGQAHAAAGDLQHFLGVEVRGGESTGD